MPKKKKKVLVEKMTKKALKREAKGGYRAGSTHGDTKYKEVSEKRATRLEKRGYQRTKPSNYELGDLGEPTPEIKARNNQFGTVKLKPQKATGSSASMRRAARMVKKMNKINRGRR